MRKMKKIVAALLTGTMLTTALTGCGASADSSTASTESAEGNVIKIGSVHPLTGSYAYEAQQIINPWEQIIVPVTCL